MSQTVLATPLRYLDTALGKLRDLGLVPEKAEEAPIISLLDQLTALDHDRVAAIARTLSQASLFNEVVREQVQAMTLGERYEEITSAFDSIRDDAMSMVAQLEDGRIDTWERVQNLWTKVTRGDVASRFEKIRGTYLEVARDSQDQIQREHVILDAYRDFRGALKESEVLALEVLQTAQIRLDGARARLEAASKAVEGFAGEDRAGLARLELARDERLRELQDEEKRYQVAKDISDNLTVGYNTSEVIMARLMQTTSAKERVYAQAVSFFGTNEIVLTALKASFTGLHGLHEGTEALEAMKAGIEKSLDVLAEVGGKVHEAALRAGYGPTVRAEAVKRLVESVVSFQARSRAIIEEMRALATRNAEEIRVAVEDGRRRMSALTQDVDRLVHG